MWLGSPVVRASDSWLRGLEFEPHPCTVLLSMAAHAHFLLRPSSIKQRVITVLCVGEVWNRTHHASRQSHRPCSTLWCIHLPGWKGREMSTAVWRRPVLTYKTLNTFVLLLNCTSANASTTTSTHGHYARRVRHCSSNRLLAPTSRNVLVDAPRRLSGTHFLRLSSEAIHCLYTNLS